MLQEALSAPRTLVDSGIGAKRVALAAGMAALVYVVLLSGPPRHRVTQPGRH